MRSICDVTFEDLDGGVFISPVVDLGFGDGIGQSNHFVEKPIRKLRWWPEPSKTPLGNVQ
jgi:hypothetical protein